MSHFIFVIKDEESVFNNRVEHKKWPLYLGTKFQKYLKIEDHIIFYQAGKNGQKFLGTAMIKSKVKPDPDKINFYIDIDRIDIWKKPLSIRNILSKLDFIKYKNNWGIHFQGGIVRLDEKDYSVILQEGKKYTL